MGFFDSVKNFLSGAQNKLPEDLNSVDEVKARAQELMQQHGETVNKVVDTVQEKIPGETGDNVIDATQDKANEFASGKQ